MDITEPSKEEFAAIVAAHPHRFAEVHHITVAGDRGKDVRLPFVLGNPSGACDMPLGATPSPAWAEFIVAQLKRRPPPADDDAAALDCVLYPDVATWVKWCERWPALSSQVLRAARQKVGAAVTIGEPDCDDPQLPDAVKTALAQHPRAALRRYEPRGAKLLTLIDPPASAAWRIFLSSVRQETDAWKTTLEMALANTRFVFDEATGVVVAPTDLFKRRPGLALMVVLTVSVLAGAASEIEVGES